MTPVTIADMTTEEPTDRSIPPEAMTAVMPIAMIATKAKFRVTLKRLRSVAKVSVAKESATHASTAATKTQNTWRFISQDSRL